MCFAAADPADDPERVACGGLAGSRAQGVTELHFEDEDPDKPKRLNFFPEHILTKADIGLVLMIPAGLGGH